MKISASRLTFVLAVFAVAGFGLWSFRTTSVVPRVAGWHPVIMPDEDFESWSDWMSSVAFMNREVGWAVGEGREHTGIFRTTTGGDSWERLPLYDGVEHSPDFRTVRFWNESLGWITSSSFVIRTTDGGESWMPVEIAETSVFRLRTLLPLSERSVILGRTGGWMSLTTDGGVTWREMQLAPEETDVSGLAFVPPQTAFASTASPYLNRGALYRSTDGGQSWELMVEGDKPLHGIAFSADGQRGVTVGSEVAHISNDGGETWRPTVFQGRHHAVQFLGSNTVISVGERPAVLISSDGGATWSPGPVLSFGSILSDIVAVDRGWWFATGGYAPGVFRYIDPQAMAEDTSG